MILFVSKLQLWFNFGSHSIIRKNNSEDLGNCEYLIYFQLKNHKANLHGEDSLRKMEFRSPIQCKSYKTHRCCGCRTWFQSDSSDFNPNLHWAEFFVPFDIHIDSLSKWTIQSLSCHTTHWHFDTGAFT